MTTPSERVPTVSVIVLGPPMIGVAQSGTRVVPTALVSSGGATFGLFIPWKDLPETIDGAKPPPEVQPVEPASKLPFVTLLVTVTVRLTNKLGT